MIFKSEKKRYGLDNVFTGTPLYLRTEQKEA